MDVLAKWAEGQSTRIVEADQIAPLWHYLEDEAAEPIVLILEAGGAEIQAVVGEAAGTALLYFPVDYARSATGSLHSVGDRAAAMRDDWQPPLTAYLFGHHGEYARWSVVSNDAGRQALVEFCQRPDSPPSTIDWEPD
jgi:hypothetical protein